MISIFGAITEEIYSLLPSRYRSGVNSQRLRAALGCLAPGAEPTSRGSVQPAAARSKVAARCRALAKTVSLLGAFTSPNLACASETGGSTYPVGVATIVPGFLVGEPGFNLMNYNSYYSADRLNDANGQKALPLFHADAYSTAFRLDYAPGWDFLGARFGVRAILPFVDVTTERQIGRNRQKDSKTGMGDMTLTPFALSWSGQSALGLWSTGIFLQFVLPTGAYKATDLANIGRNYTSQQMAYAFTLITPTGWSASLQTIYNHNQINDATRYLSGDEVIVDYAFGYKITPDITLEANGYFYQQLSKDKKSGVVVGTGNEGRVFAIGPQVRVGLPNNISLVAKWQHEMAVQNRAEGDRFWLQLFVPFGTVQTTAPSNEGDVVNHPVAVVSR